MVRKLKKNHGRISIEARGSEIIYLQWWLFFIEVGLTDRIGVLFSYETIDMLSRLESRPMGGDGFKGLPAGTFRGSIKWPATFWIIPFPHQRTE